MKRLCSISIKPNDTKNDNFSMALAEYFTKEFGIQRLIAYNKKTYVDIPLTNKYQDKYNKVIIDCLNGKMYLRGDNCNDHYWGRLSKFICARPSDAYHCVNYNATRIINRIKKLEDNNINNNMFEREGLDNFDDEIITSSIPQITRLRVKEPICQMPDYGCK